MKHRQNSAQFCTILYRAKLCRILAMFHQSPVHIHNYMYSHLMYGSKQSNIPVKFPLYVDGLTLIA